VAHGPVVTAVSRSPGHTVTKARQDRIRLVAGLGVDGDAHQGTTVRHSYSARRTPGAPNLRQVHLIHAELHDDLAAAGLQVEAGAMGENVTTRGLALLGLPAGTRLRLGAAAVVELTGLRTPCKHLNRVRPGLMRAVMARDAAGRVVARAGVMAIVVTGGDVAPGDPIRVEPPPAGCDRPLAPV
jgi:MOSC domain-containing protein YiiM